jgi:hypothetical protein
MDPFAVIVFVGLALMVLAILALGKWYPGSGADVIDWRPTRSPELEAQNEIDDLDQMLEANNRRRRARGLEELTLDSVNTLIADEQRAMNEHREAYLADQGLEDADALELLELANAGRRRRGEPELTLEEYKAQLEADRP